MYARVEIPQGNPSVQAVDTNESFKTESSDSKRIKFISYT
jgi:hypothetical protein